MSDLNDAVAIVGMALRFPAANTPEEFWQNLVDGKDCARLLSKEELLELGVEPAKLDDPDYVYRSYDIENMDEFDARFFGISPREARIADPQLRIMLEVVYECIENSGHNLIGENVGLYMGAADHKYWLYYNLFQSSLEEEQEIAKRIFATKDYFPTQISHKMNLTGPSISMTSACSTAMLATHEACNHLLMYDCDYAIAGGCEILQPVGYRYQEGGLSSRDGYVRAFDKDASGTIFGSGAGVVLLRRLSDALEDGDNIYAVIRSTAVNNDGSQKVGFMAPGVKGQMEVINEAIERSEVDVRDIGHVETHGTGTPVGDPIEIESLTKVYRQYTDDNQFCAIGSAKTNVGHLSIAAGIAGLIKTSLMLYHKKIPASLHYKEANPRINFEKSPFFVNTETRDWIPENGTCIAGLSAFGVGGTNVHAILQEPPVREPRVSTNPHNRLLLISGKTEPAVPAMREKLASYLEQKPEIQLADMAYTLNAGRPHHKHRYFTLADDTANAVQQLRTDEREIRKELIAESHDLVFMFPGQGSQYVNMGKGLYGSEAVYAEVLDECREILQAQSGFDLFDVLFASTEADQDKINQTEFTQICLFVTSYAMARLLMSWGIEPTAMIGHSIGEYAAACLADVMSLSDALKIVTLRGRLMQSMPTGSMLSIPLPHTSAEQHLNDDVSIAGINSPNSTVVSGSDEAIEALQAALADKGVKAKVLHTSHAFHSVMMEPILEQFKQGFADVELQSPSMRFISNVTGDWINTAHATDPEYWARQLRQAVLFSKGIDTLIAGGQSVFVEVGPGAALSSLLGQHDLPEASAVIRTMRRPKDEGADMDQLLISVGQLWQAGAQIDWDEFYGDDHGQRIVLPTYAFQRERFWFDKEAIESKAAVTVTQEAPLEHPLLGRRVVSSDKVVVYENILDKDTPAFIKDHRLVETVIFPGAGYTQMALEVGRFFVQNKKIKVDDIRFAQAMMLPDGVKKVVQVVATARQPYGCTFEIISRTLGKNYNDNKDDWVLHAKGRLSAHSEAPKEYEMPAIYSKPGTELIPLDRYYKALKFITFGPSFRGVKRMWIDGNESLGLVELPEHLNAEVAQYTFHPVLLDAAFQTIDGPKISETGTLPVGLKNFTVYSQIPNRFYVSAMRVEDGDEDYSIGRITMFSEEGKMIANIEHYLQKEIADYIEFDDQLADLMYQIDWNKASAPKAPAAKPAAGNWLLAGEDSEAVARLSDQLAAQGQSCVRLGAEQLAPARDGSAADAVTALCKEQNFTGIVFARGLDQDAEAEHSCLELLGVVKAVAGLELDQPPRLYLLTEDSQYVSEKESAGDDTLQQAAIWGMGNTISVEHPEFSCVRVDIDGSEKAADSLLNELLNPGNENQIVLRGDQCYIPRLQKYSSKKGSGNQIKIPKGPHEVRLKSFGSFDNFTAREFVPDFIGDDEVHVEMHSAALNFKETLYVLGYLNPNNRDATDIDFGMEGAGRIKGVGANVTHLKKGDDVMVWHNGCLTSDFIVNIDKVVKMPEGMSYKEAACFPTVYMTAYYGLFDLAQIKAGDKILIHACAGGVGQVALQIAQQVGAEVYATASTGKWDFLKSQGVKHVFNSRNLDFKDQILEMTGGKGVDIVLNSLAGDFITKSFDVLAENGRFIEIGKTDIWSEERAREYRPDVFYRFFEIGEDVISGGIGGKSPIGEVMARILDDYTQSRVKPMPITEFSVTDISAAFRYLSAGKNIGKVVVNLHDEKAADTLAGLISDEKAHLITGGLGGLGFMTAKWLVEKGAKHLVLTGRSAPKPEIQAEIDELTAAGVKVLVARGDVSSASDVEAMIKRTEDELAPLGSIFHCAGVLADAVLTQQDEASFHRCFLPKVAGSWNLHTLTKDKNLDVFVLFSSVSAIFDGGGQGNYAAANAFMDRLASYRRQQGLPGLSVNWGGWADVGMAARLLEERGADTSADHLINREEGFLSLERLLKEDRIQATICKLGDRLTSGSVPKLLSDLVASAGDDDDSVTEIERIIVKNAERPLAENMTDFVSRQVLKVLGMGANDTVEFDEEFVDLGVDSLSMTELKNAVQKGLGKNIKMATLFANATINRLGAHLAKEYADDFAQAGNAAKPSMAPAPAPAGSASGSSVEFVPLSQQQGLPNIFCVPGLNGNVFDFADFAEQNKQKYSVQVAQIVSDLGSLETDIQVIGRNAITALKEIQPQGPYSLLGYSYGGVVALETARQLVEAGDEVGFLLMVDTFPHFQFRDDPRFLDFMSALITDSILLPMSLDAEKYDAYSKKIMDSSVDELGDFLSDVNNESSGASRLNLDLLNNIVVDGQKRSQAFYQPPARIDGVEIQFVRAAEYPRAVQISDLNGFLDAGAMTDDAYGWRDLVNNQFHITKVARNHNVLLKNQGAAEISEIVNRLFEAMGSMSLVS
ncbi:MAG: hypothetical protein Tsb002_28130 [Wenzhouxiangellaceae bacterium]